MWYCSILTWVWHAICVTVLERFKNLSWLPSCVLHTGRQYATRGEHNLTRYIRTCNTRDIIRYVTRETFCESGMMSIEIEKILSIHFLILTNAIWSFILSAFSIMPFISTFSFLCILRLDISYHNFYGQCLYHKTNVASKLWCEWLEC